ncbi:unnamed protein product [Diatraea saccharalis]|uniref:Uncharacterized protein n=1 Tax=Diatraea saccharalis TaxID=40085 RepID=A0A9N9RFL2_9NEOP|nr:unnamed protein product [Diatraea saccharalis]
MRVLVLLCVIAVAGVALARPEDKYTDRFDSINIQEILKNRRLLVPYVHCALDKGKCTPEGKELKSHIKEALETRCAKCTEAQVRGTRLVIGHLINHEQEFWHQLTAKYDPAGQYTKRYEQELKTAR